MKRLVLIIVLNLIILPTILPTIVYAEDLKLTVTPIEAETIWKALRKLPVEEVEPLMSKIRQQVSEQTQTKTEPEKK